MEQMCIVRKLRILFVMNAFLMRFLNLIKDIRSLKLIRSIEANMIIFRVLDCKSEVFGLARVYSTWINSLGIYFTLFSMNIMTNQNTLCAIANQFDL